MTPIILVAITAMRYAMPDADEPTTMFVATLILALLWDAAFFLTRRR